MLISIFYCVIFFIITFLRLKAKVLPDIITKGQIPIYIFVFMNRIPDFNGTLWFISLCVAFALELQIHKKMILRKINSFWGSLAHIYHPHLSHKPPIPYPQKHFTAFFFPFAEGGKFIAFFLYFFHFFWFGGWG